MRIMVFQYKRNARKLLVGIVSFQSQFACPNTILLLSIDSYKVLIVLALWTQTPKSFTSDRSLFVSNHCNLAYIIISSLTKSPQLFLCGVDALLN